jgi:hypothetical protein
MQKRLASLFLLLILSSFQTQAQLKWGYKIGISTTGNLSTTNFNFSNRFGLQGGIFTEGELFKNVYLQPTAQLDYVGYGLDNASYTKLGLSLNPNLVYKINNFQVGIGPKFIAFLSSTPYPLTSDEKTGFGGNVMLGYSLNEKLSIQLSYSQNAQNYQFLKRYTIGLSLLGYFGQ